MPGVPKMVRMQYCMKSNSSKVVFRLYSNFIIFLPINGKTTLYINDVYAQNKFIGGTHDQSLVMFQKFSHFIGSSSCMCGNFCFLFLHTLYMIIIIIQVALYIRQELNIRTGTNFILALAAFNEECRPYLKRYFSSAIVLPSDWIEVAEFYQVCVYQIWF